MSGWSMVELMTSLLDRIRLVVVLGLALSVGFAGAAMADDEPVELLIQYEPPAAAYFSSVLRIWPSIGWGG